MPDGTPHIPQLPGRVQAAPPRAVTLTTPSIGQTPAPDTSGVASILREVLSGTEQLGQIDKQLASERLTEDALARAQTDQERERIQTSMVQLQKDAAARDEAYTLQMPDHLDTIAAAADAKVAAIEATLPEGEFVSNAQRTQIEAEEVNQQFSDSFNFRTTLKSEIARKTADADAAQARQNFLNDPSRTLEEHFTELRDTNAQQYTDVIMRNSYLGEMLKHETAIVKSMQAIQFADAEASLNARVDEEMSSTLQEGFGDYFSLPKLSEGHTRTAAFVVQNAAEERAQTMYGRSVSDLSPAQFSENQSATLQKAIQVLGDPGLDLGLEQRQEIAASFDELDLPESVRAALPASLRAMDAVVIAATNDRTRGQVDIISNSIDLIETVEDFLGMQSQMENFLNPENANFSAVRVGTDKFGQGVFNKVTASHFKKLENKWRKEQTEWRRSADIRQVDLDGGNANIGEADWDITNKIYAKMIRQIGDEDGEGLSRARAFKKMVETYGRQSVSKQMVEEINSLEPAEAMQVLDTLVQSDKNMLYYSTLVENLSDEYSTVYDVARLTGTNMVSIMSALSDKGITNVNFKAAVQTANSAAEAEKSTSVPQDRKWIGFINPGDDTLFTGVEGDRLLEKSYKLQRAMGFSVKQAKKNSNIIFQKNTTIVEINGRREAVPLNRPLTIRTRDENENLTAEATYVGGGNERSDPLAFSILAAIYSKEAARQNFGVQTKYDWDSLRLNEAGDRYVINIIDDKTFPGLGAQDKDRKTLEVPFDRTEQLALLNALTTREEQEAISKEQFRRQRFFEGKGFTEGFKPISDPLRAFGLGRFAPDDL